MELIKVALLPPVLVLLTFHWYTGFVPALVAVAVKLTTVPAQMLVCEALMLIDGVTDGATLTTMRFEVAVPVPMQMPVTVTWHVMVSPLFSAAVL